MGSHNRVKLSTLKNLRNTKASPGFGIPQGVQAFTTVFLGLLTSFGIGFLINNSAYAASYINVSSGSGGTVSLGSIKPSSTGVSASGSDTLTIHTDCATGYSVYVSAQSDGDTNLTNTNKSITSNNVISTSSVSVGDTASTLSSNTWGISANSTEALASKYVGLPTFSEALSNALTTKSNVAEETTVPIYYGVKVDTSLSPGTYAGNVLYTVIMDTSCIPYTVIFNSNGGTGTMSNQSIMTGTPTNLTQNSFTRSGYVFLGWATSENGKTGTAVNGIGTSADVDYEDKAEVTNLTTGGASITLYAIWEKEASYMQDFNCSNLAAGTSTTLIDSRDNQKYTVYRIPTDSIATNIQGMCFMTKDLNLGAVAFSDTASSKMSSAHGAMTLSPEDSSFTAPTGVDYENITIPTSSVTISTSYSSSDSYDNRYYLLNNSGGYAGRGYYSWGAAMVACPKGWRLPTIDEFGNNTESYDDSTSGIIYHVGNSISNLQGSPYLFMLGGYYYSGGWNLATLRGAYWSSTQSSSSLSHYLFMNASKGLNAGGSNKGNGFSVRCVQDTRTISDISTMQEMNSSICSNSKIGENKVLTDTRDQETYRVNKLKDGECWMVENLRISDIELDSTTSDLAVGTKFTVPKSTNEAFTASNAGTVAKMALSTDATNARAYGGYYNFVAATAGTGSGYNAGTTSGTYSICPKGWTLPTSAQFVALDKAFGYSGEKRSGSSAVSQWNASYANTDYASGYPGFILAGRYYTDYPTLYTTQVATYWSSTVASTTNAYNLSLGKISTDLYPQLSNAKFDGFSVRCIATP